ncbi:class I SAM-dependent methyltransferase [bacterium]|nr:class I SAM-dependent methyltransferase [bacterium]
MLDLFAQRIRGEVLDLACGPGQVAGYLHHKGLKVTGLDLSERMLELAGQQFPEVEFEVGDLLRLPVAAESCAGISAFYAIVHLSSNYMRRAVSEMHRVLQPGGQLLLTFHSLLLNGQPDYRIFPLEEVRQALQDTGFAIELELQRRPVAEEDDTLKALIWAVRRG